MHAHVSYNIYTRTCARAKKTQHNAFLFSFLIYSFLFSSYYNITCNTFTWYMSYIIILYNLSFLIYSFIFIILTVILSSINKYI